MDLGNMKCPGVIPSGEITKHEICSGKIKIKASNTFDFELKNTVTGEVKCYKSHNIVLDRLLSPFGAGGSEAPGSTAWNIRVGTGTGTLSPARTTLFNQLIQVTASHVHFDMWAIPATRILTATLNENQGNGLLTEVGIGASNGGLLTHSLITDAEDNQISIAKTNLDILTIRSTFYASVELEDDPNFKMRRVVHNLENHNAENALSQSEAPHATLSHAIRIAAANGTELGGSAILILNSCNDNLYVPSVVSYMQNTIGLGGISGGHIAQITGSTPSRDATLRRSRTTVTALASQINLDRPYIFKAIYNVGWGVMTFPNFDLFPRKSIDLFIGTGDGIQTEYNLGFPECNVGDEEIRIGGVLQNRNTYDFSGRDMSFAQAWKNMDAKYLMDNTGSLVNNRRGSLFFPQAVWAGTGAGVLLQPLESNPFVYDFGVPIRVNHFRSSSNTPLMLEYSHDLTNWERVSTNQSNISFDLIEARYWKLWTTAAQMPTVDWAVNTAHMIFGFDELRPSIIFDTPPAAGELITAKVTSDVPWKDPNCQIGVSINLELERA